MDLAAILRQLYQQKEKLDLTISALQPIQHQGSSPPEDRQSAHRRRGRVFMSEKERQQVSERMKAYWANKRKETAKKGARQDVPGSRRRNGSDGQGEEGIRAAEEPEAEA